MWIQGASFAQVNPSDIPRLENPVSVQYLKKKLPKTGPKLVLDAKTARVLRSKLKSDPVVKNVYEAIRLNAREILDDPLLERIIPGRRLLGVSRKMLYRMNMLGMVYFIDQDPGILDRINEEVIAVCDFIDWNPSHFLDVGEMSLAVAIAIDWTDGDLPASTIELAKAALIEKGIKPSFENEDNAWWVDANNNWNQVCHAGLVAAAIVTADKDMKLAADVIGRALDHMPMALAEYMPDGVYPEGPMYWGYGTSFTLVAASILESAFGTDFGIESFPGFKASAMFKLLSSSPYTGKSFNFSDSGEGGGQSNGDFNLAWFAMKTGNSAYFEREKFLNPPESMQMSRLSGLGLAWLSKYKEKEEQEMPKTWMGKGPNPVAFISGGQNDPNQFYFACKGGRGSVNHGNMDAGTFIFELKGIRWVVDPGNQPYADLEKVGFDLWSSCQECERWSLLTKNNFGHSTLSVNNKRHQVDGYVPIIEFNNEPVPEVVLDMTPAFSNDLKDVKRTFIKDSPSSLVIEDFISRNDQTDQVVWQLITQAEIEIIKGGAILKQDGEQLRIEQLSHPNLTISVISLDPPPLALDKKIDQLKRIELRIPAYTFESAEELIRVRLSGDE
ncbi:MAG: hypothetical protein CMJ19_15090 [Phycisphaeraceae bacterium]|nr:hypothetical protein [Phycisphaeraceae bacterium]